jgi:hypothetical protein
MLLGRFFLEIFPSQLCHSNETSDRPLLSISLWENLEWKLKKNNISIFTVRKSVFLQCWKVKKRPLYNIVFEDTRYFVKNQPGIKKNGLLYFLI